MGFRFQRRVNLGGGTGLNLSRSGIGASLRGRHGAIGSKGFSLRTGIPGLSFRQGWGGKLGDGAVVMLVMALMALAAALAVMVIQALIWLVPALWQAGRWCVLTVHDYICYRRTGMQPGGDLETIAWEEAPSLDGAPEKTLREILAEEANPLAVQSPSTTSPGPGPAPAWATTPTSRPNVVQQDNSNTASLMVAGAMVLGLVLMVGMCSRLGRSNASAPEFKDADAQVWRATMLDDKQPASVRLSNAQAIIEHFPNSSDAGLANSMRPQLAQASDVETIDAAAATTAREADRQAMIDRKERRDPAAIPASPVSDIHMGELVAVGAVALASQARLKPSSSPPLITSRLAAHAAATTPSRSTALVTDGTCPCSGSFNCTGPRGGQFCITSGGKKRYRSHHSSAVSTLQGGTSCPCSGSNNCVGPRGGQYCYTSGGNKRYR